MNKKFIKVGAMMLVACAGLMTLSSCSSDDDNKTDEPKEPTESTVLSGALKAGETRTLKAGVDYVLSGEFDVEAGAVLKIEPGTKITAKSDDDTPDYILIKQDGKIDAQGTADKPIVMTTAEGTSWGGIHICGRAHTNKGTGSSEIGGAPYGGNKDDDNSGVIRYVKLERTGFALDPEHEANGISLYGVGNGTTIENVFVNGGKDDGIEFFGGSVNVKNIVCVGCEDDSFDWTEGWNGKAQFLVADQKGTTGAKDNGDCLMECDNNGDNNAATPVAHPVISNITLIGNNSEEGKRGIRLRAGTEVEIYNALIVGKNKSITVETVQTETALKNGVSKLMYITCDKDISNKEKIYTDDDFIAPANNNVENATTLSFLKMGSFVGTLESTFDPSTLGSFFAKAIYRGAVDKSNDWTAWMFK